MTVDAAVARLFTEPPDRIGATHAVVVLHRGAVIAERYDAANGVDRDTTLISWSMAKSITHAAVGLLVGRGLLDPDEPAGIEAWQHDDDGRRHITLEHLLRMVDGLDFVEDYVDDRISDVIHMLFREGRGDVAAYATARPAKHPPGAVWNYSSGTSNIVAAIAGRAAGGTEALRRLLVDDLFGAIGMTSAIPKFDAAGTFIGSSFVYATARDFARFGQLYLEGGRDVLPPGWADHAVRLTPGSAGEYGAHWWLRPDDPLGTFYASGYEGQRTVVVPPKELVVVRLGKTPIELAPNLWPLIDGIIAAV